MTPMEALEFERYQRSISEYHRDCRPFLELLCRVQATQPISIEYTEGEQNVTYTVNWSPEAMEIKRRIENAIDYLGRRLLPK
jgi:hypothetical protein